MFQRLSPTMKYQHVTSHEKIYLYVASFLNQGENNLSSHVKEGEREKKKLKCVAITDKRGE